MSGRANHDCDLYQALSSKRAREKVTKMLTKYVEEHQSMVIAEALVRFGLFLIFLYLEHQQPFIR